MPASARALAVAAAVEVIAAYISRQRRPLIQAQDTAAPRTSVRQADRTRAARRRGRHWSRRHRVVNDGGVGARGALLWVVALAAFLKCFLNEGLARWQLATGTTAIEAWTIYLPWWVRVYFARRTRYEIEVVSELQGGRTRPGT
jgi:hypothetical protein